jgi:hypothetical protein
VWRHLTDTARYDEWNPLIGDFHGKLEEGADISFRLSFGSQKLPLAARVVQADGHVLRWEGPSSKLAARIGHASHYFRLERSSEGSTDLEHGEYFGGPAFELLWPALQPGLLKAYESFNAALAARCEAKA